MLLFWRKNRLKVKAIRQKDSTDNKVKYLPISFLLESLDEVRDEFPDIFSYEVKKFSKWVHNKAIQKSIESYRITSEQKEYLRTFRIS